MKSICILVVAAVVGLAFLSQSAEASNQARLARHYKKHPCKEGPRHCGPVYWKWKLPPGNGHYIAPNKCIGPAYYYTPAVPRYAVPPNLLNPPPLDPFGTPPTP